MSNIPEPILWFVGFMIVANLASIGSMLVTGFKVTWWASQTEARLTALELGQALDREKLDEHWDHINTLNGKLTQRRGLT